jgi:oligopeptidase B
MPTPPSAPQRPHAITRHGDTRIDPYYWLMDRENDEVLSLLRAENEYLEAELAPLKPLEDELFEEIKSRVEETDISVPVRKGDWWYFVRTREGLSYSISVRLPAQGDDFTPPEIDPETTLDGEQVILDENVEAEGHDFLSVGVLALSPDERWVAVGTDFEGNERHHVTVRPMAGQEPIPDALDDVYYGFAWATDNRHFFYTRVDDAMRPWQLWRHELGTTNGDDVLVYQEDDEQYTVSVGRSRDDLMIVVMLNSSMTSEVWYLAADSPIGELTLLEERRHGIEYGVEHFVDQQGSAWWLKMTNEGATDFRLLARPVAGAEWREVVPERPGCRLDGVDAFASFLAVSDRENGCAALRLVPLLDGDDPFGDEHDRSSQSRLSRQAARTRAPRHWRRRIPNLRHAPDFAWSSAPHCSRHHASSPTSWWRRANSSSGNNRRSSADYDPSRSYVTGRLWVSGERRRPDPRVRRRSPRPAERSEPHDG